jgi:hypothetical protein
MNAQRTGLYYFPIKAEKQYPGSAGKILLRLLFADARAMEAFRGRSRNWR